MPRLAVAACTVVLAVVALPASARADRIWCGTFSVDRPAPALQLPARPTPPRYAARLTRVRVDGAYNASASARFKVLPADCLAASNGRSGRLVLRVDRGGTVTSAGSPDAQPVPACLVDVLRRVTLAPSALPHTVSARFTIVAVAAVAAVD